MLSKADHNLKSVFEIIHDQGERIFSEYSELFEIRNVTYHEFKSYVKKTASYLKNNGLSSNHKYVGLLMDNSLNWVAMFWAILMLGNKPVLLNKKLPISFNEEIVKLLDIDFIITDSHNEDNFKGAFFFVNQNKILPLIDKQEEYQKEDWEDELVLSTTATTLNYKICIYKGTDIYSAIMNARGILRKSKTVKEHYEQRLKVLAFLPFYHIFGLMAAYFWFSIFGRTFVFLRDYSSETILKTIQRHKITHIFAVPLLWNTIAKELKKTINHLPEKDKKKAKKGIKFSYKLQNMFPNYGRRVARKLLKPIQSQLFGDSVLFCISGGGSIPKETLYLINAIGYPLYNGYGSTEMGITSVELRNKPKYRVLGTVGMPLESIQYKIENNELLVKGTSICSKIIYRDGREEIINKDEWYHTGDMFSVDKHGYYSAIGRNDDVFIGQNGEKTKGILNILDKGEKGESYLLTGHQVSVKELIGVAAKVANKKSVTKTVPHFIIKIASPFLEMHARIHKKTPLFTGFSMDCLKQNSNYSYDKAKLKFGYSARELEETMKDTIDYLLFNNKQMH